MLLKLTNGMQKGNGCGIRMQWTRNNLRCKRGLVSWIYGIAYSHIFYSIPYNTRLLAKSIKGIYLYTNIKLVNFYCIELVVVLDISYCVKTLENVYHMNQNRKCLRYLMYFCSVIITPSTCETEQLAIIYPPCLFQANYFQYEM